MRAALLMLAACAAAPPTAKSAPAPTRAPAPTPTPTPTPTPSIKLVVAEVVARIDECSGLGGEHYVLKLHDGSSRVVHAGGHGISLDLVPFQSTQHAFVIAEVDLEPIVLGGAGWCLSRLKSYPLTGHVRRILRVTDLAAGRAALAEIVRRGGLPAPGRYPRVTRLIDDPTVMPPCARAICNVPSTTPAPR